MNVATGIVGDEKVDLKWVQCLLRLKEERQTVNIIVEGSVGSFDVGRNKVARFFLEQTDADWLLTLDTDMMFLPEHLDMLLAHDQPIVSGIYFINDHPPRANAQRRREDGLLESVKGWAEHDVLEVDALGHGFCLIRREVFKSIGPLEDADRSGPWYRQDAVGASGSVLEPDYAFCQRAQQAGYPVLVDTDCFVGHLKPRVLGWES